MNLFEVNGPARDYFLARCVNEDASNYVQLFHQEARQLAFPRKYLLRQVDEPKVASRFGPRLDYFIRYIYEMHAIWPMQFHKAEPFTYLTVRYFTLGLQAVREGFHRIRNMTRNVPMYVWKCRPQLVERYRDYSNVSLALVNKLQIVNDFDIEAVFEELVLYPGEVYFFYTVTHSLFSVETLSGTVGLPMDVSASGGDVERTERSQAAQSSEPPRANEIVQELGFAPPPSIVDLLKSRVQSSLDQMSPMAGTSSGSADAESLVDEYTEEMEALRDENAALRFALTDREERIQDLELKIKQLEADGHSPGGSGGPSHSAETEAKVKELERKIKEAERQAAERERQRLECQRALNEREEEVHQLQEKIRDLEQEKENLVQKCNESREKVQLALNVLRSDC